MLRAPTMALQAFFEGSPQFRQEVRWKDLLIKLLQHDDRAVWNRAMVVYVVISPVAIGKIRELVDKSVDKSGEAT